MKSFEINALGLEEMNSNEIVSVNGGSVAGLVMLAVCLVGAVICLIAGKGNIELKK